jgi:hypothetical protein
MFGWAPGDALAMTMTDLAIWAEIAAESGG